MRKLFCFLLLIAGHMVSTAQQTQPYLEVYRYLVNVRSGPSIDFSVRGSLWVRDRLTVTGKNDATGEWQCTGDTDTNNMMWLRVDLQGIEGWVNYCAVVFVGDLDSLPVVEPAYPETLEWINMATIPQGIFFTRITDKLGSAPDKPYVIASTRTPNFIHLRAYPRLSADILDHISGDQVYVTGVSPDGVWMQVEYDAKLSSCLQVADSTDDCPFERLSGWVARFLLSLPREWQETFINES